MLFANVRTSDPLSSPSQHIGRLLATTVTELFRIPSATPSHDACRLRRAGGPGNEENQSRSQGELRRTIEIAGRFSKFRVVAFLVATQGQGQTCTPMASPI